MRFNAGVRRFTDAIAKNSTIDTSRCHLYGLAMSHRRFITPRLSTHRGHTDEPGGNGLPHFSQIRVISRIKSVLNSPVSRYLLMRFIIAPYSLTCELSPRQISMSEPSTVHSAVTQPTPAVILKSEASASFISRISMPLLYIRTAICKTATSPSVCW